MCVCFYAFISGVFETSGKIIYGTFFSTAVVIGVNDHIYFGVGNLHLVCDMTKPHENWRLSLPLFCYREVFIHWRLRTVDCVTLKGMGF